MAHLVILVFFEMHIRIYILLLGVIKAICCLYLPCMFLSTVPMVNVDWTSAIKGKMLQS